MPPEPEELSGTLPEQAGYWIVRQHSGDWSTSDEQAFHAWLAQGEQHRQAYQAVEALWRGLDQKSPPFAANQSRTNAAKHRSPTSRQHWLWPGMVTALLVMLLLIDTSLLIPQHASYATPLGQRQALTLADGSQVLMNTNTELVVELGPFRREIKLKRGEAAFNVTHQNWRPFAVTAGAGKVVDIGTRFSMYQTGQNVEVTVTEGRVEVSTPEYTPMQLTAGQQLNYNSEGVISAISRPDLLAATAWQHGQMVLNMTPLGHITQQLTRYHAVSFVFDDPKLERLQISGIFNIDDLPLFLNTLQSVYPLQAARSDDGVIHFRSADKRNY